MSDASSSIKVGGSGCKDSQSNDGWIKAAEALDQITSMGVPDGGTGEVESLLTNSSGEPGVSALAKGLQSPQTVLSTEESGVQTSSGVPMYQGAKSPDTTGLPYHPAVGLKEESGFRASLSGLSKEGRDPGMGLFLPPVTPREQESSVEALREIKRVSTDLAKQEMCTWVSPRPFSLFKGDGRTGVTVPESQGSSPQPLQEHAFVSQPSLSNVHVLVGSFYFPRTEGQR